MNEQTQMTESKSIISGFLWMIRPAAFFIMAAAIAVLVMTSVYTLTVGTIARHDEEAHRAAMASVMPEANVFSEMYCEDTSIDRISGAYNGTTFLGYCVEVTTNGFGGPIRLMVGVDANGSVTGVSILEHSETNTLGADASGHSFLKQYIGKSGSITVNTGTNSIHAVTGATTTSKAVTQGVNAALTAVLNYDAEGGLDSEEHG